jgi:HSP20 family molecular chaperone IbpA
MKPRNVAIHANKEQIMSNTLAKQEENAATIERTRGGVTYSPRVDIVEAEEKLILFADLPGVAPDDLDIRFENRELTIQGKVSPRHNDIQFVYGEYGIGDFYRTFTIGEQIDSSKITAELKSGVLTLHLPKMEHAKPRRIEVKTS